VESPAAGWVAEIETEQLGLAIIEMGGGRMRMHDWLDLSVGLEMQARVGDRVERDQPLVRVYAPQEKFERVARLVAGAFRISEAPVAPLPLIATRVREE
jgi:thymidine phosphorylase